MIVAHHDVPTGVVGGQYDERFASVVATFVRNFAVRDELGASLCVVHDGVTVVDVWGGCAVRGREGVDGRPARAEAPWGPDSVSIVYSCTKGATALCAHLLAASGKLDLDAPVAELWPEFASGEKARATVRMMLDHTVGVPVLREQVTPGDLFDWERMVARLEAEPPFWEPGTRSGYHMVNFGWTVGELVRRASGVSLGQFFAANVAEPLGLDFWIGLPVEHEARVAPMVAYRRSKGERLSDFALTMLNDPASIPALAVSNLAAADANSREYHAAEIGAAGGITNGRGLAGMYAPLAAGGGRLVGSDDVERMRRVSAATNCDATLRLATRFGLGFMVSIDNRAKAETDSAVLGAGAFGHVGAGGSIGFADPDVGLAFGYTMNRMGPGVLLNERGQSLVDATYAVLGGR